MGRVYARGGASSPCVRLAVLASIMFLAGPARADRLPEPAAEFEAVQEMAVGDTKLEARVNHARGMERREMRAGGIPSVLILRPDRRTAYLFQPDLSMAMVLDAGDPELGLDPHALRALDATRQGKEAVAGLETTLYDVQGTVADGTLFTGRVWSTDDGIIARLDGTLTRDGRDFPLRTELRDVQRRAQSPSLFDVPEGTRIMTLEPLEGRVPEAFRPD